MPWDPALYERGLPIDDLRDRLRNSPWKHGKLSASENWLREAADALSVTIKRREIGRTSITLKTKEVVVQEVIEALRELKRDAKGCESSAPHGTAMGGVAQVGRCLIRLPLSRCLQLL